MQIDHSINIVEHDIRLAELGLRPESLPALRSRLATLRSEAWRQFQEGLAADAKREADYAPKPGPILPPWMRWMGYDHYLDSMGRMREQRCDVRADI